MQRHSKICIRHAQRQNKDLQLPAELLLLHSVSQPYMTAMLRQLLSTFVALLTMTPHLINELVFSAALGNLGLQSPEEFRCYIRKPCSVVGKFVLFYLGGYLSCHICWTSLLPCKVWLVLPSAASCHACEHLC